MQQPSKVLEELNQLSTKLNKKSNELNPIISSVNEKLAAMNIGLEVWLEDDPIETTEVRVVGIGSDAPQGQSTQVLFGYCCVDDRWQLAIRTDLLIATDGNDDATRITESKQPLLKCSRALRTQALIRLCELLADIKDEIGVVLDDLENAELLAAKL